MPTQRSRRQTNYGYPNPQAGLQQEPIVSNRDPLASDSAEIGTIWCNTVSNSFFILTSSVGGINTWAAAVGGAEILTALQVNSGNIDVSLGDININVGNLNMAPSSVATLGKLIAGETQLT